MDPALLEMPMHTTRTARAFQGFLAIDSYTLHNPNQGVDITREVLVRGHAACVLVYDPALDLVLMVEEFRIGNLAAGYPALSLGPVAGMVEGADGALATIIREAREEAGLALNADQAHGPLSTLPSPGGSAEVIHHFIAQADLSGVEDGALYGLSAEGEETRVRLYQRTALNPIGALGPDAIPTNGLATTCLFLLQALLDNGTIIRPNGGLR